MKPAFARQLLYVIAGFMIPIPLSAKEAPVYGSLGIIGEDNRVAIDNTKAPWMAIGQVNISGLRTSSLCTGTRIAPSLVLVDAGCIFDFFKRKSYPPQDIHFVAGVRNDHFIGHSTARCVHLSPLFDVDVKFAAKPDIGLLRLPERFVDNDLALIVLNQDIKDAGVVPLATAKPAFGQRLVHVAYAREKRRQLTGDKTCRVIGHVDEALATNCDSGNGGEGGPLLVEQDGTLKIAAVMATTQSSVQTIATPVANWPDMPMEATCP
jgi:protease YdgD